jgi:hypothetical protein
MRKKNEWDMNDEGEVLSSGHPTGPVGGSRTASSQVGLRRLSRRDEACDPFSAQPLVSRAGFAPTRDGNVSTKAGCLQKELSAFIKEGAQPSDSAPELSTVRSYEA